MIRLIVFLKFKDRSHLFCLRAAEKINYPILLVSRPGHCVAAMASYNQYETVAAPCARADIRRNFGIFIIFRDPNSFIAAVDKLVFVSRTLTDISVLIIVEFIEEINFR